MSATAEVPREVAPQATVALVLGASVWPRAPRLEAAPSFAQSARDLVGYLTDATGFALPRENLLDLFDRDAEAIELQDAITEFLAATRVRLEAAGIKLRDIIVFYVGHGAYDEGAASEFYLAIRRTRAGNELASSLSAEQLARVLRAGGRRARRYVILDCCFAGAAAREFTLQSGLAQTMVQKLRQEFPEEGTALLCSSSRQDPSKAPRGQAYTMFSGALLDVLRRGDPQYEPAFSIEALAGAMTERIRRQYEDAATRPEVHCPDQRAGQVSLVPLFHNPAAAAAGAKPPRSPPSEPEPQLQPRAQSPPAANKVADAPAAAVAAVATPPAPSRPRRALRIAAAALVAVMLLGLEGFRAAQLQQDVASGILFFFVATAAALACVGAVVLGALLFRFGRPVPAAAATDDRSATEAMVKLGRFAFGRADLKWALILLAGGVGLLVAISPD